MMATRNRIHWTTKASIHTALKKHLVRKHGVCKYLDGYTDEMIANEVGNGCTAHHVANVRRESFGKMFYKRPKQADATKSEASPIDVANLVERLTKLEAFLARYGGYKP